MTAVLANQVLITDEEVWCMTRLHAKIILKFLRENDSSGGAWCLQSSGGSCLLMTYSQRWRHSGTVWSEVEHTYIRLWELLEARPGAWDTWDRENNVLDSTTDHTCVHVEISLIVWLFDSLMLSHQLLSWAREVITDNNDVRLEREILFSPSTDYCVWLPSPHHPQQPARTELKASCLWLALSDSEQVFYISSDTREGRESWNISHEYQTLVSTGTNHPPPALNTFIKSWTKKLNIVCICSNEGYKSGELRQSCDGATWDNVHAGT